MSKIDKCCCNCVYFKIGWCDLFGIVPYPPDKIDCGSFAPKPIKLDCVAKNKETAKQTVFDHITQSVEALADKFVYHIYLTDCLQRKCSYWRSTFFPRNNFSTKEKAIAATVNELKKEYKG